jgi:hypothetical protein
MVTANQDAQAKEFLQKVNIRTMRKDLKQLREADALKEREKISNIGTQKPATTPLTSSPSHTQSEDEKDFLKKITNYREEIPSDAITETPVLENENTESLPKENILPVQTPGEQLPKISLQEPIEETPILADEKSGIDFQEYIDTTSKQPEATGAHTIIIDKANLEAKKYATESEKQQIFLLEAQKVNLENQINENNQKKEALRMSDKNAILVEQKNWQNKINPLAQEQEKADATQRTLEEKLKASSNPSEQQNLQKQIDLLEDQKQIIEKRRWVIEGELKKLEEKSNKISGNYQQFTNKEHSLATEIAKIQNSLSAIYAKIAQREVTRKKELEELEIKKEQEMINQLSEIEAPQEVVVSKGTEKNYLKKVMPAAKEKLVKEAETEEKQRKKFMEEVEAWASSQNNLNT